MQIEFLGTRGEIDVRTRHHRMHSCLLLDGRVLIDCGADWLGRIDSLESEAIVLTHAHPDHAGGLKSGTQQAVYATQKTWEALRRFPIPDRHAILPRQRWSICGIELEAFEVEHSLIAPAVGYRIAKSGISLFYVPDLVSIQERHEALSGIALYIGDGASILRPLLRRRNHSVIGHASIRNQLDWCRDEGVRQAVITHCGSQIVRSDPRAAAAKIEALGQERGVHVEIAHDGTKDHSHEKRYPIFCLIGQDAVP
jgi:phosphoribosyl 1,2-cyclic phosphodiesterase